MQLAAPASSGTVCNSVPSRSMTIACTLTGVGNLLTGAACCMAIPLVVSRFFGCALVRFACGCCGFFILNRDIFGSLFGDWFALDCSGGRYTFRGLWYGLAHTGGGGLFLHAILGRLQRNATGITDRFGVESLLLAGSRNPIATSQRKSGYQQYGWSGELTGAHDIYTLASSARSAASTLS